VCSDCARFKTVVRLFYTCTFPKFKDTRSNMKLLRSIPVFMLMFRSSLCRSDDQLTQEMPLSPSALLPILPGALLPGRGLMTHPAAAFPWAVGWTSRLLFGMGQRHTGGEPRGVIIHKVPHIPGQHQFYDVPINSGHGDWVLHKNHCLMAHQMCA
jgi:hypothetical protein